MATNNSVNTYLTPTSGQILAPGQCAFSVYNNASQGNVTGNGTVYQVQFNTKLFDLGSNFASNTFTAPVTGHYLLTCLIALDTLTSANTYCQGLFSLTGGINSFFQTLNGGTANISGQLNISGTLFTPMAAGDTCIVKVAVYGSTKTVNVSAGGPTSFQTIFSGYLVC